MYPELYSRQGIKLAVLNNIIEDTARIKRVVNGEFTFTFEALEAELKSNYLHDTNVVRVEGQTFDLSYLEYRHNKDVRYQVQCEHVNYRLLDGESNLYETYTNTGTPTIILTDILSGTEFDVGIVEFTEPITISAGSEITKKALIYELAAILGGEIEYTNFGFTINILNTIGQNNGFEVRFGKNLLGITKFIDRRGDNLISYTIDIVELKNTTEYIEKGLQGLEVIGVGDTVRIVDEIIGLDIENRIISIEYNPLKAINTYLEIANTIKDFSDRVKSIKTETVKTDRLYNNVSIGNEYGFRAVRSDDKARIEMNATEGLSVFTRSDVNSEFTKKLSIDSDGNIVMSGIINLISGSNIGDFGDLGPLGELAYLDDVDWDNNLIHIPNALKAPSGDGLYLSSTNLGFYQSGNWRTYMDNEGNFFLGGAAGKLQWISNTNTLVVNGVISLAEGSSGLSNMADAGNLATKDHVDFSSPEVINKTAEYIEESIYRKWAAQSGADVTSMNIAAGFNGQGALATLSQISETHISSDAITTPKIATGAIVAAKIAAEAINAVHIKAGAITAGKIQADAINGFTISGVTINGGTINGGEINVVTDVNVGNNIYLSSAVGDSLQKSIVFNGAARIRSTSIDLPGNTAIEISASALQLSGAVSGVWGEWKFRQSVDFSDATVTGLQVKFA